MEKVISKMINEKAEKIRFFVKRASKLKTLLGTTKADLTLCEYALELLNSGRETEKIKTIYEGEKNGNKSKS